MKLIKLCRMIEDVCTKTKRERWQREMSEPLRVAQVLGCVTGYGVENEVMRRCRTIDHNKIQFDFIANDDSTRIPRDEIELLGGHLYTVPSYQHLRRYLCALKQIFLQNKYHIVQSNIGTMSAFSLYVAKEVGVPVRIIDNHTTAAKGEGLKTMLKLVLRPFAKRYATHYAACSEHAATWMFGEQAVKEGKVAIIYPTIIPDNFAYNPAVRTEVRRELKIDGSFVVGHVGRFCYQKNQEFLIDIFHDIHEKRPNAKLMLIGDGETMHSAEEKIARLGLTGDVLLLGRRDDVNRLLQAMDVFIFPSRYEGLGLAVIEAQLAGLKVVASTELPLVTKVREDMTFLSLSDDAEQWAQEALRVDTDHRLCTGDFSRYDVAYRAKWFEQYYQELYKASEVKNHQDR